MELSMKQAESILKKQRDRWMEDSLRLIYTKSELIEKIENDFLSENDITDRSVYFGNDIYENEINDLKREMCRQAINYHFSYKSPNIHEIE